MKGKDRNKPCVCGGGRKSKNCCGGGKCRITGYFLTRCICNECEVRKRQLEEQKQRIAEEREKYRQKNQKRISSLMVGATALTIGMSVAPIDTNSKRKW